MTLREARVIFTGLIPRLIDRAIATNFEPAIDEATVHLTEKAPTSNHISGSLHHIGLALDLVLYKDGVWQDKTWQYNGLGDYWESLHEFCHWGGRFGDGNHFSFSDYSIPGCTTSDGILRM